ncbi:MAG: CAP domain-containing protein [Fimbriimonadaceae bacterium]
MFPHKTLTFLGIAASALVANGSEPGAYTRVFGPKATMLIAKPTLRWEIWPGGRSAITEQKMLINGVEVRAYYSKGDRSLMYTPDRPLAPGEYKVKCRVVIDDSLVANKEWTFTIATGAAPNLAPPDSDQIRAFRAANVYRTALGLEPFRFDDRLNGAALAHSKYLAKNNTTGHFQKPGTPGYFGQDPGARLESFGFIDESWENVAYGNETPEEAITSLVDAPYHRIPFMQPGAIVLGAGFNENRLTVEFGANKSEGTVVYPAPGQSNVPTLWNGNERPNPLRLHDAPKPVGYIIVLSAWQPGGAKLKVQEATLRNCADGSLVPAFLNTPSNDDRLDNSCFIIPKRPLRPGTTYEVLVRGSVQPTASDRSEVPLDKRWRFTTATKG